MFTMKVGATNVPIGKMNGHDYVMKSMLDALEQIGSAAGGLDYRLSERSPIKLGGVEFSEDEVKKMVLAYTRLEEARVLVYKAILSTEKINLGYTL